MNRFTIAAGAGAMAVMLAGCGPKLAQVPYGEEEARWQKILRENYSGYEAPRTAPPAIRDNVSPRLIEKEQALKNGQNGNGFNPPPPADEPPVDDPGLAVDRAAERPAVKEQAPAASPAEKKEVKPAEKKADNPAAKPADKKEGAKAEKEAPKGAVIYEVKPKDDLSKLAQKFYGDAGCRDVIIRANPSLEKNPDLLRPGMKLVIPKI